MSVSAPRLTRMNDWYLVNQLNAYRTGVRGTHKNDLFGQQMVPVGDVLASDQAVRDLVAYLYSLD